MFLLFIPVMIIMMVCSAFSQDDDSGIITIPNQKPILTGGSFPGFIMKSSDIHRDTKSGISMIIEKWHTTPVYITYFAITLYPLKDFKTALQFAEENFYASTEKDEKIIMGKPFPGSYTGQTIGDRCWIYRTPPSIAIEHNCSKSMLFIKAGNLVLLTIDYKEKEVPVSFAEAIAKKIASSL